MIRPVGRGRPVPETNACARWPETGSKSSMGRFLFHMDAQDAQDFFRKRLACSPEHPLIRRRSSPESASPSETAFHIPAKSFFVQPSGTRSWIQRLLIRARRRELGLGSVALVPLAEAREKALANRRPARQGGDPLAEKRRAAGIPTFADAAMRVLEQKQGGWRNPRHSREWQSSLERFAFPRIGKVPVSEVTSADLLEILTPLRHRKAATAKHVRRRLRAVLEGAVAMEYRLDNPCDRIAPVLGPQKDVAEPMEAVPHREAAAVIRKVRASTALPAARLAIEFLVLTAARWGEVRRAEWKEIDREGKVWTVPARRTKTNRRRRVPLCGRALATLEATRALGDGAGPLVFTHGVGKPMHDSAVRRLLRQLGIEAVSHGFRSIFRD